MNRKLFFFTLMLPVLLCLLPGCGKADDRKLGVDGYVYVPEKIPERGVPEEEKFMWLYNFQTAGGYLYYMCGNLFRIPIQEELNFESRETVCPGYPNMSYTLDEEQNLYYHTAPDSSSDLTVCKRSPDGTELYSLLLPGTRVVAQNSLNPTIAVDDGKNVYLLSQDSLLRLDPEGQLTGKLSLDEETADEAVHKYLLESGGNVYFFADNYSPLSRKAYLVTGDGTPALKTVDKLSGTDVPDLYEGLGGLLLSGSDGIVCQYHPENDSVTQLLRWEDSNLQRDGISSLIPVSEEHILLSLRDTETYTSQQTLMLLTRTPVHELPEREILILASLFPSEELKKSVVRFNQASQQYHVSIESYGALNFWEDNEGPRTRLDGSLAGNNPPDLLDLSGLDIHKYVQSKALDDLYQYMGENGDLREEDYLPNLLDSYTFDEKLICIPKSFYCYILFGLDEKVPASGDWNLETVMELTRRYPKERLLSGYMDSTDFMLEDFCSAWYLEKCVDWENGTCHFDSEAFRQMLEWIDDLARQNHTSDQGLLTGRYTYSFDDYQRNLMEFGERLTLQGYPSADGSRLASVIVKDALSLVKNSRHKEGAWAFLQYYLTEQNGSEDFWIRTDGFPTRLDHLDELQEYMTTPSYAKDIDGNVLTDQDGSPLLREKCTYYIDNKPFPFYVMDRDNADVLRAFIETLDFTPRSFLEQSVIDIVTEESAAFFSGAKTVTQVMDIIQNRVGILISEQK